jgi:hypothetical protein
MGLDPWIRATGVAPVADAWGVPGAGRPAIGLSASPNPFSSATSVRLALARPGRVRLDVFDIGGRLVRTLADGAISASTADVPWDGRDASGRPAAPGVYVLRVESPDGTAAAKAVRLR